MERDSFVFYRSFFEALSCLDKEQKADCLDAIAQYALNGEEPEIDGVIKAIFVSVKPQIDANNRRYTNGCKGAEYGKLGGRPKKNGKGDSNKNPIGDMSKNPIGDSSKNPKETRNVNENDNENVNDNVNENVNDNVNENDNENVNVNVNEKQKKPSDPKKTFGENGKVKLTDREYEMLVTEYGVNLTNRAIEYLDGYIVDKGYKSKSNYLAIRRWVIDAVQKRAPAPVQQVDDFFSDIWRNPNDDGRGD